MGDMVYVQGQAGDAESEPESAYQDSWVGFELAWVNCVKCWYVMFNMCLE